MVILKEVHEASSSSSSPCNGHHQQYDVFLSFRGADTRLSFTNHLHKALEDANLKTFLDDEEIETGVDLKPELEIAIKASRASVIVLSKNYATSTWCLDELVLILDQQKNFNQIVIPIFYHVEPTDVRKQQNSFGDAMEKHKQRMDAEIDVEKKSLLAKKIEIWKAALTRVSHLKGKNAKNRLETEFIEEIVKDLSKRIRVPIMSTLPLLIGREESIEFMTSWLKDETVDILTLYGMGGIGKTSLAKYVYQLHFHEFSRSSFIEDISRRCAQTNGLLDVQKQLCDAISNASSMQVYDVSAYTSIIENTVTREKVLLVLDDIDGLGQLDALLGNQRFHPGSKIIITTRDASVTERCALFNPQVQPKHKKQLLNGLYATTSRKLLCLHAFKCKKVQEGYEEVFDNIVKYCEGHPLALQVLGRHLHNRDVAYWVDSIKELKKGAQGPGSAINNVLRLSFVKLSPNDKELFMHIACFFVKTDRDYSETILKACKIRTGSGITNLIDRCLLHIGWDNEFTMHSLIQEMGRDVVHQESPDKPEERSRLWCRKESFKVLKKNRGTGNTKGLTLDMRLSEKEKSCGSLFEVETEALSKMHKLMLLQLNNVQLNGSYEYFPKKLRWLCMQWFPLESLPSDLPMKKLVALDLSYSNIKSFDMSCSNPQRPKNMQKLTTGSCSKDTRLLGSLKILDVSFCKQLHSLGGFFELPALERLLVRHCIGLIEICESIELCAELDLIDLRYCNRLEKLPRSLRKLNKVKTLLLDGCNLGKSQIEMRANNIGVNSPTGFKFFAGVFPSSLVRLSLEWNNLSCESFPMDWSCLSMLKELRLDGNPIVSIPNCVRTLPRLEYLNMADCYELISIEHLPPTLTHLNIFSDSDSFGLQKIAFDPEMSPITLNVLWNNLAYSSMEVEGVIKVQPMSDVEERLLLSLGWRNLDFTKKKFIKFRHDHGYYPCGYCKEEWKEGCKEECIEESQIQMYYQFGIFSTIYGGEKMPNWITHRIKGPSISLIIPSSSENLFRGLNVCVLIITSPDLVLSYFPVIKISNITKNRTWIYRHFMDSRVVVYEEHLTYISHWMFTKNDMEPGDHVTITTWTWSEDEKECMCGVSFVYEDGSMEEKEEEEEDVLGRYKSWNHIIGGDLSAFELTTGEYLLDCNSICRTTNDIVNGELEDLGFASSIYKVGGSTNIFQDLMKFCSTTRSIYKVGGSTDIFKDLMKFRSTTRSIYKVGGSTNIFQDLMKLRSTTRFIYKVDKMLFKAFS